MKQVRRLVSYTCIDGEVNRIHEYTHVTCESNRLLAAVYVAPISISDMSFVNLMLRVIHMYNVNLAAKTATRKLNRICKQMYWRVEIRGQTIYIHCFERSAALTTWFRLVYS